MNISSLFAKIIRWKPDGKKVDLLVDDASNAYIDFVGKHIEAFVTSTDNGDKAILKLVNPISVGEKTISHVKIVRRHKGYDLNSLRFSSIAVNIETVDDFGLTEDGRFATGILRLL